MSAFLYEPEDGTEPFVYVHIPKAGGTSIRKGILRRIPYKRKLVYKGGEDWPWHRSFATFRSPVERFLSGWGERAPDYDIDRLLRVLRNDKINHHPPGAPGSGNVDIRHHMLPLTHNINLRFVDKILEEGSWFWLESVNEGWEKARQWLGLPNSQMGHMRQGRGRSRWEDLDDETQSKILEFLEDDIEFTDQIQKPMGGAMCVLDPQK